MRAPHREGEVHAGCRTYRISDDRMEYGHRGVGHGLAVIIAIDDVEDGISRSQPPSGGNCHPDIRQR